MLQVIALSAFSDNYIWVLHQNGQAIVIDPGEAAPVTAFLDQEKLQLSAILLTHHHPDHIDGVNTLKHRTKRIIGPQHPRMPWLTETASDQNPINFPGIGSFKVINTPGHTLTHICYVHANQLFCGDTLFSGGCGRLFEGTPEMMYHSLKKLSALADDTKVYCAHEYTLNNLKFAQHIDPNNKVLAHYLNEVIQCRANNKITLPSNIGLEKQINPFMRCDDLTLQRSVCDVLQTTTKDPINTFAMIRKAKDTW